MYRLLILLSFALLLSMPTRAQADIVLDWNSTMRDVVISEGMNPVNNANPGWATRAMAMTNGAIYDIYQSIDRTHQPFVFDIQVQADTSRDAAVHQAAYELLSHNYPTEQAALDAVYNSRMATITDGIEKSRGINLGHAVAQAYRYSRTHDGAEDSQPYMPGSQPGEWRPDPYNPGQQAWGPGWGTVNTFAISNTSDYIAALPAIPALNSQAYADAYNQVKDFGALNSTVRTADQTEIGLFWAYDRGGMGPPPVMFLENLHEISLQAGNTPEQNARLFAMASVSMADAAISAWDAKFTYNFWRPVTGIQEGDFDGNSLTMGDPSWKPLGAPGSDPNSDLDDFTPPFPAWTSGHATMGGALYKTLELFYGTNVFDDIDGIAGNATLYSLTSQEDGSGGTRYFATFTQEGPMGIGLENSPEGEIGTSRIYLGIHWMFDQEDGITLGNNIAYYVHGNMFQPVPEPGTLLPFLAGLALLVPWLRRRRSA